MTQFRTDTLPQSAPPAAGETRRESSNTPANGRQIIHIPELRREEYPHIRYWFRNEWDTESERGITLPSSEQPQRGRSRASKGENVRFKYLQQVDGTIINGHEAGIIRKYARGVWDHMSQNGPMPSTWGTADAATASHFHRDMITKFPLLAFCHANWKADQIATETYPYWSSKRAKKVKEEPDAMQTDYLGPSKGKRHHSHSLDLGRKRSKTILSLSSSSPSPENTPALQYTPLLTFSGDDINLPDTAGATTNAAEPAVNFKF